MVAFFYLSARKLVKLGIIDLSRGGENLKFSDRMVILLRGGISFFHLQVLKDVDIMRTFYRYAERGGSGSCKPR